MKPLYTILSMINRVSPIHEDDLVDYDCIWIGKPHGYDIDRLKAMLPKMLFKMVDIEKNLYLDRDGKKQELPIIIKDYYRYHIKDVSNFTDIFVFKFRYEDYTYLDIYLDEYTLKKRLKAKDVKIWSDCDFLRKIFSKLNKQRRGNELHTTEDEQHMEQPEGFNLKLHDYQLQELRWMIDIESNTDRKCIFKPKKYYPLYDTGYYIKMKDGTIWNNDYEKERYIKCNGGILANKMGMGKTVSSIALIHLAKCSSIIPEIPQEDPASEYLIPSRATLIIVPTHLAIQWKGEINKCVGDKLKVIYLITKRDDKKYSMTDLIKADIVLITYPHLKKICLDGFQDRLRYKRYFGNHEDLKKEVGSNMICFWWHRIIFDEYHEQISKGFRPNHNKMHTILSLLKGGNKWGLSGTPSLEVNNSKNIIFQTMTLLQMETDLVTFNYNWSSSCQELVDCFLNNYVRKNVKIELPPLHDEIIYVDHTDKESCLYKSSSYTLCRSELLKLCSHHYIGENDNEFQDKSIEQICSEIQGQRIERLTLFKEELFKKENYYKSVCELIDREEGSNRLKTEKRKLEKEMEKIKISIKKIEKSFSFFEKTIINFDKNIENNCPICLDTIQNDDTVITPCGHTFCCTCLDILFKKSRDAKCPHCRLLIKKGEIQRILTSDEIVVDRSDSLHIKYGSKIRKMVEKIQSTNGKIIILAQWDKLLHKIGAALKEYGIKNVYIKGNVYSRNKKIDSFKKDKDVKVIMLSVDFIGSGLNLTEATNVFIVHPFDGDFAKEKELQGIARAHRQGQTKSVNVVRFITKDTIEEEILKSSTT
jgi:DNA repair protein RAD5